MSRKHLRPWKVRYHYDGTKSFTDPERSDLYWVDTSRPIEGTTAYRTEDDARAAGRRISRHGGDARVLFRDPDSGRETDIVRYSPYESAMQELTTPGEPSGGASAH